MSLLAREAEPLAGTVRQRSLFARRDERRFFLFILPWLVGFVLFQAGPMLFAIGVSFTDWLLVGTPEWRGLAHYRTMRADPAFHDALRNTLYYSAASVPLGISLAFLLALLLNRRWAGMSIFRTIFFVPSLVSGVAIVLVWGWLFNPRYGAVNSLLGMLGLPQPGWLGDPRWAMPTVILLSLWSIGGLVVIFLAGLQNVPAELYDAARIDGAGRWATLRSITLPMVSPVTFFLLVIGTIGSLQVFAPVFVLTEGGPRNSTLTLPLYIYQNAFTWQKYGYAAALTVVLIAIALTLTLIQLGLARRWVFYTGWSGR